MTKQGEIMNDTVLPPRGNGKFDQEFPVAIETKKGELTAINAQPIGDVMQQGTVVIGDMIQGTTQMAGDNNVRATIEEEFTIIEES